MEHKLIASILVLVIVLVLGYFLLWPSGDSNRIQGISPASAIS